MPPVMTEADTRDYLEWRASLIDASREVNLIGNDLASERSFRGDAWRISKRLGLSMTCDVLERNLYFRRP